MSVDAFKPENWSQELRAAYEKAVGYKYSIMPVRTMIASTAGG